jgi:hypothetical protein
MIVGGLTLIFTPPLAMRGAFMSVRPGRLLASAGVMSYALLIVNEPMRSITHTMRAEGAATVWVAAWVLLGFIPLTFILATPLARWLGLVDRERAVTTVEDLVSGESSASKVGAEVRVSTGARPT